MSSVKAVRDCSGRNGADVLLEVLESEGIEYIFGNPGTTELPLIDALLRHHSVKYVFALQEASAVAMADGYAQATRKPGFINLHTAGGLGHGMGNLINAKVSQTPLVVTAGQQDLRHTLTDPLLYDDLVSIARPNVKWAQEVTNASQLPILLRRAFNDADAAPKGPVFLSLPMDVMEQKCDVTVPAQSRIIHRYTAGSLDILAKEIAHGRVVTVRVDGMTFLRPVAVGDVVCCYGECIKVGNSSLKIKLETWVKKVASEPIGERYCVTEAAFTYVAVDREGRPRPLPAELKFNKSEI